MEINSEEKTEITRYYASDVEDLILKEIAEKEVITVMFVGKITITQRLIEKITLDSEEMNEKVRKAPEIIALRLIIDLTTETLGRVHRHRPETQVEVQLMRTTEEEKKDTKELAHQKVLTCPVMKKEMKCHMLLR